MVVVGSTLCLDVGPALAQGFDLGKALRATGHRPNRAKPQQRISNNNRYRAQMMRTGIHLHRRLSTQKHTVKMPKSAVLTDKAAASKKYADSWTCRESSKLLIKQMAGKNVKMQLDSSGKNAFRWGDEGLVSYHYYAVDNPQKPTVLLDPTATSNFGRDAQPGGMMHSLLAQAGKNQGQPKAAERVARRIAKGGVDGLLVLGNQHEISVYREALELAAKKRAEVTRNAERANANRAQ